MAWLGTNTDTAADAASAKMLVSQSETTDYLYQHPSAPQYGDLQHRRRG